LHKHAHIRIPNTHTHTEKYKAMTGVITIQLVCTVFPVSTSGASSLNVVDYYSVERQ